MNEALRAKDLRDIMQVMYPDVVNMVNNGLWTDGGYDRSTCWLLEDGTIEPEQLWEHIEMACGMLFMPEADPAVFVDACILYWDERGGLIY
jgi:hypothetical protein